MGSGGSDGDVADDVDFFSVVHAVETETKDEA